jgi:hypothetical protein
MYWYHYLAYFFGGAFLSNSLPHLINGVSGRSFQSPFAKPPGKGLSSSTVNVLWGFFNLAVAYLLVLRVGQLLRHPSVAHVERGLSAHVRDACPQLRALSRRNVRLTAPIPSLAARFARRPSWTGS